MQVYCERRIRELSRHATCVLMLFCFTLLQATSSVKVFFHLVSKKKPVFRIIVVMVIPELGTAFAQTLEIVMKCCEVTSAQILKHVRCIDFGRVLPYLN
jgi:hypothetical protein